MWNDYSSGKKTFFMTLAFLFLLNFLMTTHTFFLVGMNYSKAKVNEKKIETNSLKMDSLKNDLKSLEVEVNDLRVSSIKKEMLIKEIQKELEK